MSTANKILMGAAGAAGGGPSEDQFNRVSFLSHFEGANNGVNNVFDDSSTSNHTITANGNATQGSFGPFARPDGEWGWFFDGNGDYVHTPESAYSNTGSFTVEAWVYTTVTDTGSERRQHIIAQQKDNDASRSNFNLHIVYATQIVFVVFSAAGDKSADVSSNTGLSPNTWTHIAGSFDGSNLRLFVNGVLKDTTASTNAPRDTTQPVAVGARTTNDAGTAGTEFFQGYISNARLTKSAVYTSAFTPSTSSLTAITNTSLLTCQSNRFVDNSASGHTVTPVGNTAVSAFGPILTSAVYDAAVNGASAYLDGSGDTLRATWTAADIVNQNFTLEYWLYFTQTSGSGTVSIGDTPGSNYIHLSYSSGGDVWSDDGTHSGSGPYVSGAIKGNCWNHLALVRSGTSLYIYANGAKIGTKDNITTSYFSGQSDEFGIGYIFNPLKGYVCDARIVTSAVYSGSTYTVPTAPLTAITNTKVLLNMADGQAIDSAAQNNLTLIADSKLSTTQAKFGDTSMYFDGSGDYALFPNTPFGTGDFTVECWVRCLGTSYDKGVWDNHTDSGTSDGLTLTRISEQQFRLFGTGELIRSGNFTITNTWVNVTVVRSSGTLNLFVNGVSQGTTSFTTNLNSSLDFVIGGGRYSGGPETGSLNAYIDEFRISHMARYTSNFTPATEPFEDKGR